MGCCLSLGVRQRPWKAGCWSSLWPRMVGSDVLPGTVVHGRRCGRRAWVPGGAAQPHLVAEEGKALSSRDAWGGKNRPVPGCGGHWCLLGKQVGGWGQPTSLELQDTRGPHACVPTLPGKQ